MDNDPQVPLLPVKRERFDLSLKQKKEICRYKEENPAVTQGELAAHFSVEFKGKIGRSTVSDILRNRDRWVSASSSDDNAKRFRQGKHPQLEQALFLWLCDARSKGVAMSDHKLKEKGEIFGDRLGIVDFSYSQGWMANFKRRYGVTNQVPVAPVVPACGSPEAELTVLPTTSGEDMKDVIAKHHPHDVYGLYESFLYHNMEPNAAVLRDAADSRAPHWSRERLTVVLPCNATGSDKCKPLVVGKASRPRSFGSGFDVQKLVDYHSNKKAWLTGAILSKWLKKFDTDMRAAQRHVLLLLESSVPTLEKGLLTNVQVQYLSEHPGLLQASKVGIMKSFKIKYRKLHVQYLQKNIEYQRDRAKKLDVKSAIYMIKEAWKAVKAATIQGFWLDSGMTLAASSIDVGAIADVQGELKKELKDLDRSILQLHYECPLRAGAFIELDKVEPSRTDLTEDDIIELVTEEDEDDCCNDDEPLRPPSLSEARASAKSLLRFIECEGNSADESMISDVYRISCHLDSLCKHQEEQPPPPPTTSS